MKQHIKLEIGQIKVSQTGELSFANGDNMYSQSSLRAMYDRSLEVYEEHLKKRQKRKLSEEEKEVLLPFVLFLQTAFK